MFFVYLYFFKEWISLFVFITFSPHLTYWITFQAITYFTTFNWILILITFNWSTLYGLGLWIPCILKCTISTTISSLLYSEFGVLKMIHKTFWVIAWDAAYQPVVGYLFASSTETNLNIWLHFALFYKNE